MHVSPFNTMDDEELRALVAAAGSAELITAPSGGDGFPEATRLPVVWAGDRLIFHVAVANPHWRSITAGTPALAVVSGPEAYISPSWYAAKAEHGRVVPTWNYSAIHFRGRATVHRDPAWVRAAVTRLTAQHEAGRDQPWEVGDAPESFTAQMLRAIVGVELRIEGVDAKAKRSQNRSDADRDGVISGLLAEPGTSARALAAQMQADLARGAGGR